MIFNCKKLSKNGLQLLFGGSGASVDHEAGAPTKLQATPVRVKLPRLSVSYVLLHSSRDLELAGYRWL